MKTAKGFTLIELICALAVFVLLSALMLQMMGNATSVVTNSRKALDADSQARLVFSLMERELARALKDGQVDFQCKKSANNDEIYFFSEAPAQTTVAPAQKDPVSLIGYRIKSDPRDTRSLQMQRLGLGLAWADSNSSRDTQVFLTYDTTGTIDGQSTITGRWGIELSASGDSDYYSTVASQVFRFEYCFLLKDGSYSNFPVLRSGGGSAAQPGPPSPGTGNIGDRWFDESNGRAFVCQPGPGGTKAWRASGLRDVTAIVVTLAILDQTSRKIVDDTTPLPALLPDPAEGQLSGTPQSAELMQKNWQSRVESAAFRSAANLPDQAAAQVRVYQRHIYLK